MLDSGAGQTNTAETPVFFFFVFVFCVHIRYMHTEYTYTVHVYRVDFFSRGWGNGLVCSALSLSSCQYVSSCFGALEAISHHLSLSVCLSRVRTCCRTQRTFVGFYLPRAKQRAASHEGEKNHVRVRDEPEGSNTNLVILPPAHGAHMLSSGFRCRGG